jgi:hypothetical protein
MFDDPLVSGFLANLAGDLAIGALSALAQRTRQQFESPDHQAALARCFKAGASVLLPEAKDDRAALQPALRRFFERDEVQQALSALLRGRELDVELLRDWFDEATANQALPAYDFETRLADFSEAFFQAVANEPALVNRVRIEQGRAANASLLQLVRHAEAIRRAVEQVQAGTGDIRFDRDATVYGDVVTGIQHIINIYQAGGQQRPADYEAALKRYLDWLCAAAGKVVLRGIKRGGQQAVELSLQEVYVPLEAEALPEAREQLKQGLRRKGLETEPDAAGAARISMRELLAQGDRLAVIGGPGCGKTTVLQHIAWTLAEALRTRNPALAAGRLGLSGDLPLPVIVPLSL